MSSAVDELGNIFAEYMSFLKRARWRIFRNLKEKINENEKVRICVRAFLFSVSLNDKSNLY